MRRGMEVVKDAKAGSRMVCTKGPSPHTIRFFKAPLRLIRRARFIPNDLAARSVLNTSTTRIGAPESAKPGEAVAASGSQSL